MISPAIITQVLELPLDTTTILRLASAFEAVAIFLAVAAVLFSMAYRDLDRTRRGAIAFAAGTFLLALTGIISSSTTMVRDLTGGLPPRELAIFLNWALRTAALIIFLGVAINITGRLRRHLRRKG